MKNFRFTPAAIVSLCCAAAAIAIVIGLILAKKPWEIGPPAKIRQYVAVYEWWAGAFNALLLIGLAATSRLWLRKSETPPAAWFPEVPRSMWFWPLVIVAMAVTAYCGWQRISFSVWDDEDSSVRRVILGEYRPGKDGQPVLKEVGWEDAFWNYRKPSNHHLQTILSKASLSVWRKFTKPQGLQFTEAVMRWPILVAAVASITALALLLRRLGFTAAAVAAAFLLALHPWHIRYAVELRGYLFTLLFGPLTVYCLIQAIASGRWRWWLGFAVSEFGLLYAYPGTLYMVLAANGCGLLALWFRHSPEERPIFVPRIFIASAFFGMVYLQLMAPCIPQLLDYLDTERAQGELSPRWHMNMAAHLVSGIPWNNSDNRAEGYPELLWITGDQRWITIAVLAIPTVLILLGAIRLFRKKPAGWLAAILLLVPAMLVYAMARKNNHYLYEWYLIFILPGLCACAALALDWLAEPLRRFRWGRFLVAPLILIAGIAAFAVFTQPARQWMLTHPLQPIRDAVLTIRGTLDPKDPRQKETITVGLGVHLETYDAHVIEGTNLADLKALARQSDLASTPLFVVTGNDHAVKFDYPDLHTFVRDRRYFEPVATLPGMDPSLTQYIWSYRPNSLLDVP